MNTHTNRSSGSAIVYILLAIVVLAMVGIAAYWVFVLSPKQQVKASATGFVDTSVKGDYEKVVDYANTESTDDELAIKAFAKGIDEGVGGDDYSIQKHEVRGNTATVVFIVNDDSDKTIRLELKKVNGKWGIEGVVYKFGETTKSDASSTNKTTSESTQAQTICLPADSLEKFWRYTSGWEFYFDADQASLNNWGVGDNAQPNAVNSVKEMAVFYNNNKQYQFSFVIDISLYEANDSQASRQLALDRAKVVAYNMHLQGIPYERIRLGRATSESASSSEYAAGHRRANVSIDSSCDALSSPPDFTKSSVGA